MDSNAQTKSQKCINLKDKKSFSETHTILNRVAMSLLKTPDSRASTWPPTYVSESSKCPS